SAVTFGVLTLWQHLRGPRRRVLGVMLLGVFLLALVSVLYAEALLAGRYRAGRWIDVLWVIAFLAFATGAREERRLRDDAPIEPDRSPRFAAVIPTAALAVWMIAWLGSQREALVLINATTG